MTMKIDKSWTLFLDRDGVINRVPGRDSLSGNKFVNSVDDFVFIPGALAALRVLAGRFGRIIIVTNQQGIAKGFLTEDDLREIHEFMLSSIILGGGRIDKIYHCPDLDGSPRRKPEIGMALDSGADFPEIDLKKSWMVGDSETDALFAKNAGMQFALVDSRYDLLAFAWEASQ